MRISNVEIENFRCLGQVEIAVDDPTILIGANGTGKSSVLRAIEWFFGGGGLEVADVCGQEADTRVTVGVTFCDLTPADQEALGPFAMGETATFWRKWSFEEGDTVAGRTMAYPPFKEIRDLGSASERKSEYSRLKRDDPSLELPTWSSDANARQTMQEWEAENPDKLEPTTTSAASLFSNSGEPRFAGRFDYLFVPAVADAEEQTRHGGGDIMKQVMKRLITNQEQADVRLKQIQVETARQIAEVLQEEHGGKLAELSEQFTGALQEYVPAGSITLEPRATDIKIPSTQVGLKVADGNVETDVGRQGHGFQRALLMAAVQELARAEESEDTPALFLAIEEPELYQHPAQARHFARTLSELPRAGEGALQVGYASHNEHFVDPARYERLRRFRKTLVEGSTIPTTEISRASTEQVAQELSDIVPAEQVAKKISITLRRKLSEAVFAHCVVLVEGWTDEALLRGIAEREGGFDAMGVAVVEVGGKMNLPLPWAVLKHLGIPVFIVFDGDDGTADRGHQDGKQEGKIAAEVNDQTRWNRNLLTLLGLPEEDWPETTVGNEYAIFSDTLEGDLQTSWPPMFALAQRIQEETGDRRPKSEDAYQQAAEECEGEVPHTFTEIMAAIKYRIRS